MPKLNGGRSARQYILWAFKMTGCTDCGFKPTNEEELARMDCDHRDPTTKTVWGARSIGNTGADLLNAPNAAAIFAELWKCDPVCFDCHVERGRRRGEDVRRLEREQRGEVPLPLKEWIEETTNGW